ncbi:HAD family hydrolase [Rummeliibacillus sp. SL167]|uniref:HAD family hydrolase n=1 Tax=Rummeliibacillus sp. SL167 TaxID=2579792 RepID=UPI0011B4C015|nr:HAD family hydrolase [Rummeliibacillus sp. SL167]
MQIKNLIFDFDGTLADSRQCSVLATQQAFIEFGLKKPSEKQIEYYMGVPIEVSFKKMATTGFTDESFEKLLTIFRQAYKNLENKTLSTFPNIPNVLESIASSGKQLFVVSSKKSDVLLRNLQTLNINTYFKDIIGSDKVTHYKPHPEGILKLMDFYQLNADETVMIGDTIFDLQMAKSANVFSCGVTWGSHSKEALQEERSTFLVDEVNQLAMLEELWL